MVMVMLLTTVVMRGERRMSVDQHTAGVIRQAELLLEPFHNSIQPYLVSTPHAIFGL
jgi:hypothetical protein